MQTQAEYLVYIVSHDGISVDPRKTAAVQEFPKPVDLKSLPFFLGLASYYRRFIPEFSALQDLCMPSPGRMPHLFGQITLKEPLKH